MRRLALAAGCTTLALAVSSLTASAARAELDLLGSWFVLIHYRDSQTANPDADRWADKVWRLETKGSRLQWSEYPIVVFSNGSGRFGAVAGNPRSRLLVSWEPSPAQLQEIAAGPRVNSRGSKTKTLRGSPKRGYESVGRAAVASAMTVGYQETWSIEDPTGLPIFTFDDSLGTSAALSAGPGSAASGRTRYTALEVSADGNRISGSYTRDKNRQGTFRLIRAGTPRALKSDGRTPNEKRRDRVEQQMREAVRDATP
jgi:hypothetical protein